MASVLKEELTVSPDSAIESESDTPKMGKKKGKKKRAPKQDDDPFGDTDGIFGEAKASREKEVLATPIAAEELKLDGGSVSPPFEEITPEEMEEMEAARERAAEEKAAAARAAAKAEAEAAAAEEAARKAEEEAAAAEAAEKAAAEAKAAESSEGESTETAPAPTSLGVDIEDDNDEDDMLSLLDSLEEKAKESKSVSPKAPTPTEKLAKAKAEVDSLFDDFDADNAAQDDADMAAILAMVNEDPEVRIARARAKAEEEEAAERQAAEEAEAKAKAEAEAEAKAKAEAAAAAEAEAKAKAEAEAEAQAKAEAEAQAKAEAEAEAQAKAEAEAKAEEEAKIKAEEEAAKLKAAEEAEAKVAEEAKVEAEAQAIADAEAATPSQVDVEPQSDAAEGAAKPETDPQPDTAEASNDGDTADTDPAVAAAEPPAAENDNDSDGYVHIDASDEAAPLDEPAASTQESKQVEPDLDSADDEFVQAGEEVEDADPAELAKQLQAAKAALAASRAQQSQLQTQLGAVRAECGVLREDLERSEEATEQVQEVSAETMLQCSQLEAKLADATARIAELTSAAAGAKELQALLDAANQDIAAKDTLIASDLDEIKRYQGLADAAKAKAEEAVKNVAVETEALVAQVAEARAEADRMRTLFDGKEIELRDANAMAREASTRAVTAEEKVDEVVKVNDDLLRELKTSQGQLEAAKAEAEEALLMRETQLVEKEQLVSSAEKKIVTLEEDLRKLNSAHDELQVTAAGDKAALQARIDRKTAELDQLAGSIDEADTEKEELRAKMAATQAHAVQVQKAALKYDQEAKAELEEMRQAAAAQKTKLEQYVHDNVELSAKVEDLRTQLELSDGRIRELVGSNPSDPRTEIVRLRMTLTTFEQERARYEAKITNLTAQLDGVTAALKATTTRASELQSTIDNTVDRSGQLAVAENMAKLLEDEAKTLRERISKEVSDRVNAETALAQMQLDLKHTKKKVDSLESDLAVARSSAGFGASSGLMGAPASGMTLGGDAGSSLYGSGASSAVTTSIGGIEYFNPQSYGSYNKGYGGGGGAAIGGGNSFATSMTEIDTMRDLKLAEDRAKAAEKREAAVLEKLHKIEAEAAGLRTHGEKSGYIGIDVHTRLIDMADERARDADRKVRDLETEIISLRNRARVGKGLQYLEGPDPQVTALLSKLNQCVIGAKRILPDSGGANLTEADFAEQAARDERAWKARMAEQERRREEAERSLAVAVDQEVQRRAELGLPVSGVPEHKSPLPTSAVDKAPAEPAAAPEDPTAKRVPPATTPKPKKKEKGSVHDKVQAFSDGGPATDEPVKSDYKPVSSPAPRRLNNALMSKIAGSIPGAAAVGATAADIMKAARRQRADTVEGEDDDDEWDGEEGQHIPHASEMPPPAQAQPAAAAATEPSEPSEPAPGSSTDDLVGEVVKAPSLTGQFARPQIQRGKRLPSRKKSKSAMSPAVPTDEPEAEPAETAAPPQPKPTPLAAAMPPPKTRAPADSDEEEEDDEDWGEEESPAPPSKAALMARMAKLAGANRPGGGMPLPVVTPQPHDDADEVEPAAEPVAATPPVQKKKAPPSPAPSPKPVVKPPPKETAKKPPPPVKQKTPKVAPKVAKKSPKPGPKKAEERSESKPPATPTPEVDKPTKVPAPTQLFAASDDSDLFASAKPAKTKGGKKKGTSLFNLSDDSDDDWLK